MTMRIMVTGAGSVVGQGIVKALRLSKLSATLIASDIAPLNAGLYRADEAILLPKVESEDALEKIMDAIRQHRIDAVLVGSEFDMIFFATHRENIERETGVHVLVSPADVVKLAHDKYLTAQFLKEHRLPYPDTRAPATLAEALDAAAEIRYPVILKARSGTSNRHVHVVEDASELKAVFFGVPDPLVQALIMRPAPTLGAEYTGSIFKAADGKILGPFAARRTLRGGSSWVVEVCSFAPILSLLHRIAELLPIRGTFNVQLMVGPDGPVPFEFNARFSGTTAIRAHFGFNEAEMAIRSFVLGESLPEPVIRDGVALRYEEEVFLEGVCADDLAMPLPRGEVHAWF